MSDPPRPTEPIAAGAAAALCRDDDIPDLHEFLDRMGVSNDPERTAWWHTRNPNRCTQWSGPWITRREGAVVGTVADVAFLLRVDGRNRPAAWAINAVVDATWRGSDVASELWQARKGQRVLRGGLGLSKAGLAWALHCGWHDMGVVPSFFCLLDARAFSAWTDVDHRWLPVVRPFVPAAVRLGRWWSRRHLSGVETTSIESFDERADAVWRDASPSYRVIGVRDAPWLRWRFDEGPLRTSYLRYYVSRGHSPIGYFVLRPEMRRGHALFNIVDYLATPDEGGAVFASAVRIAAGHGAGGLSCHTLNSLVYRQLRSLGFFVRGKAIPFVTYAHPDDPDREVVSRPANWFLTAADSDVDTLR